MENNEFDGIKILSYALIVGAALCSKEEGYAFLAEAGMQVFLENLKQNNPGIFGDKQFILSLIREMPWEKEIWESNLRLLELLYYEFLEKELQSDKEVYMAFLYAKRYGYEDPNYLEYGDSEAGIPYDMLGFPDNLILDKDVFSMLIKKTDPLSIYTGLSNNSEKLNDALIRRLLKWYEDHLYGPDYVLDKIYDNLKQFQAAWVESIQEHYRENEEADKIYKNLNPYVSSFFSGLVDEFLESIKAVSYYGEERDLSTSMRSMLDRYKAEMAEKVQREIDFVSENVTEGKEDRIRATKAFAWEESLEKVLSPYFHQMELFDGVLSGDFTVLDQEEAKEKTGEKAAEKTEGKKGTDDGASDDDFMNAPIDDGDDLPF